MGSDTVASLHPSEICLCLSCEVPYFGLGGKNTGGGPLSIDYSIVGARIRYNRVKRHLSQEQLAEKVNSSNVYISYVERGERIPSLDFIIRIANSLGISADDLLSDYLIVSNSRLQNEELGILFDCSSEEIDIITNVMSSLKKTLRAFRITR